MWRFILLAIGLSALGAGIMTGTMSTEDPQGETFFVFIGWIILGFSWLFTVFAAYASRDGDRRWVIENHGRAGDPAAYESLSTGMHFIKAVVSNDEGLVFLLVTGGDGRSKPRYVRAPPPSTSQVAVVRGFLEKPTWDATYGKYFPPNE